MNRPKLLDRKMLLVAVRVRDVEHAIRNIQIAKENGADGAFLLKYKSDAVPETVAEIYSMVRLALPDEWLGVNFQDRSTLQAIQTVPLDTTALWVDDAGISAVAQIAADKAREYQAERAARGYQGVFFGGVSFTYHRHTRDPARIARWATGYLDVLVTSSWGTNQSPDIQKLKAIKREIGDFPHAVTGGLTLGNLPEYRHYASIFIMRQDLLEHPDSLDFSPTRVARAADLVRKTARRASA